MPWNFDKEAITFCLSQYANGGGTAVEAWCSGGGGVYATISVNLPDAPPLPEGQFYLKNWSENERIARSLIAEGIIEAVSPPIRAHAGFVTAPAFRFTELGMQYCGNRGGQQTLQEALTHAEPIDLAAQGTSWQVQPEESSELNYEAVEHLYGFPRPEIDGLVQLLQQYYPGTLIQNRTVEWAVLKQRDIEAQNVLARAASPLVSNPCLVGGAERRKAITRMTQEEFDRYKVTIDVLLGQHPTIEQGETRLEDLTIESIHEYMRYGSTGTKEYALTIDDQQLREVISGLEDRLALYRYNIGLDEQRSDLNEMEAGRLERCRRNLASTQTLRDALWILYLKGR